MKKLFTLLLSVLAGCTMAQNAFNNKGVLIKNTSTIKVRNGDITTDPTSVTVNYGTISFTNGWYNTGLVTSNGGTEECSGNIDQIISGIYGSSNFYNFIRNQVSGTNVQLPTDFVCYTLGLGTNPGLVYVLNSSTLFVKSPLYNAINNYSNTTWIWIGDDASQLTLRMNDTIPGHWYTAPVGNSTTQYFPIQINLQIGTQDTDVTVKILGTPSPVINIDNNYSTDCFTSNSYYGLHCLKANCHSLLGPITGRVYIVRVITPPCVTNTFGFSRAVVGDFGFPDWNGLFEPSIYGGLPAVPAALCAYTNRTGSDTIPGGPYERFNRYVAVAGHPDTSAILPVEFLGINAETIYNKYIKVTWATASEEQCKEFQIQRSLNGTDWIPIGTVPGNGTTPYRHDYYYDDFDVSPNIYYYRLKQIDLDGTFSYSPVVSAKIIGTNVLVGNLYPNPNNGEFAIDVYLPKDNTTLTAKCYNVIGQELFIYDTALQKGFQQLNINHILAKGTYILNLFIDNVSTH